MNYASLVQTQSKVFFNMPTNKQQMFVFNPQHTVRKKLHLESVLLESSAKPNSLVAQTWFGIKFKNQCLPTRVICTRFNFNQGGKLYTTILSVYQVCLLNL